MQFIQPVVHDEQRLHLKIRVVEVMYIDMMLSESHSEGFHTNTELFWVPLITLEVSMVPFLFSAISAPSMSEPAPLVLPP